MHGLVNRAFECFLRDSFGAGHWAEVARNAGVDPEGFEPLLNYEAGVTDALITAAVTHLERPRACLLEDFGTYLVSHERMEALRRLLRFGGVSFVEFLYSLEELHGRARLALPGTGLPQIDVTEDGSGCFRVCARDAFDGIGHVVVGVLRAMADDYGALVVLEHDGRCARTDDGPEAGSRQHGTEGELVHVMLLDQRFAAGRQFDLAGGVRT